MEPKIETDRISFTDIISFLSWNSQSTLAKSISFSDLSDGTQFQIAGVLFTSLILDSKIYSPESSLLVTNRHG